MLQQGKQLQARSLCHNFFAGNCKYGDLCKFTHDLTAFLEQAPPALPGLCPFTSLESCPYGELVSITYGLINDHKHFCACNIACHSVHTVFAPTPRPIA